MPQLLNDTLPTGVREELTRKGTGVSRHAAALKKQLETVENHIKRGVARHVPSCGDAEPGEEVVTCPEHCLQCAFGTASGDPSCCLPCTRVHTLRCAECAAAHSLERDFDVLLKCTSEVVAAASGAVAGAAGAAGAGAAAEAEAAAVEAEAEKEAAAAAAAGAGGAVGAEGAGGSAGVPAAAAGAAGAGVGGGADGAAVDVRMNFKELRVAIARALKKVKAYHAHERRAAHEAKVMEKLLRELDETGCIVVADWKQKFLSAAFREAMSDYFGKAGMWASGVAAVPTAATCSAQATRVAAPRIWLPGRELCWPG